MVGRQGRFISFVSREKTPVEEMEFLGGTVLELRPGVEWSGCEMARLWIPSFHSPGRFIVGPSVARPLSG